jgi:hypothetical protein
MLPCAFALWRLGLMHGPSGRSELQLAYNLLKSKIDSGRLSRATVPAFSELERMVTQISAFSEPTGLNLGSAAPQSIPR